MANSDLARRVEPGALATAAPIDQFRLLDQHTGALIEPKRQQPTLATISAGYNANAGKEGRKQPVVSRDGTIYVDGYSSLARAFETVPGLAKALDAQKRKRLTVTFPFDEPSLFIQQHFAARSASALLAYGDHTGITRIVQPGKEFVDPQTGEHRSSTRPEHLTYPAGSPEYLRLLPHLKVETSVYFLLAGWEGNQAVVVMPDGLGLYRLRMTSHNSAHAIVNSLRWVSQLTGGRFAGVPFELWHDLKQVPGPDGTSRQVPVWNLIPRPPETLKLTSANFRQVFGEALQQGEQLKILPPPMPSMDLAELEGAVDDAPLDDDEEAAPARPDARPWRNGSEVPPTEAEHQAFQGLMRQQDGLVDPTTARRAFFGAFKDTPLDDAEPRAAMVREFTRSATSSLATLLKDCTDGEFANLMAFAQLWLNRRAEAARPLRQTFRAKPLAPRPEPGGADDEPFQEQASDEVLEPPRFDPEAEGMVAVPESELHVEPALDPEDQPSLLDLDLPPVRASVAAPLDAPAQPSIQDDDMLTVARNYQREIEQAGDHQALQEAWARVEAAGIPPGFMRALTDAYHKRGAELVRDR